MAQGLIGVNGVPRNITEVYVGVGGARRACAAIYVGVSGAPRLAWSGNKYKGVMFGKSSTEGVDLYTVDYAGGTYALSATGKKPPARYMACTSNMFFGNHWVSNGVHTLRKINYDTMAVIIEVPCFSNYSNSEVPIGTSGGRLFGAANPSTELSAREYDPKTLAVIQDLAGSNYSQMNRFLIGTLGGTPSTLMLGIRNEDDDGKTTGYAIFLYDINAQAITGTHMSQSKNYSLRDGDATPNGDLYTNWYSAGMYKNTVATGMGVTDCIAVMK